MAQSDQMNGAAPATDADGGATAPGPSQSSRSAPSWLLCDCAGSAPLDAEAIAAAGGVSVAGKTCSALCGAQSGVLTAALAAGEPVAVACAQETETFSDLAAEAEAPAPMTVDIRDRALWSDDAAARPTETAAKAAALLAEAALPAPPEPVMTVRSEGVCLVYGPAEVAIPAAQRLADTLSVTCMITNPPEARLLALPEPRQTLPLVAGRIVHAAGALGAFTFTADAFAEREPAGRGPIGFQAPRDGAQSACDIILDLSGDAPLFPAAHKRDGYLRADPADPVAVATVLFDAAALEGEFDKTVHIRFEKSLCAHSRASQTGCNRCLSVCPTGAITIPEPGKSEHVAIDPAICAGCGACAAVCPSGAAVYDAPPAEHLVTRLRTLVETYRRGTQGDAPRILVHDADHGRPLIAAAARFGRGLPADVIPVEVAALGEASHGVLLAALGLGAAQVSVLIGPRAERESLGGEVALAARIAEQAGAPEGAARAQLLDITDPDALTDALDAPSPGAIPGLKPILPLGAPRALTRLAAKAIADAAEPGAAPTLDLAGVDGLPATAPYGAVLVDSDACTLCLACVSLCPSGALGDNPDKPELRFQEDACLQCGICASACPETAITLKPQLTLDDTALRYETLHGEEPFACTECGALFGVKSTIERIAEKLAGQHWMYTNSDNVRLIQMCDDCRVRAQMHGDGSPFMMGERPRVRTTDDYRDEPDDTGSNGQA